jgi:hypothetical protein
MRGQIAVASELTVTVCRDAICEYLKFETPKNTNVEHAEASHMGTEHVGTRKPRNLPDWAPNLSTRSHNSQTSPGRSETRPESSRTNSGSPASCPSQCGPSPRDTLRPILPIFAYRPLPHASEQFAFLSRVRLAGQLRDGRPRLQKCAVCVSFARLQGLPLRTQIQMRIDARSRWLLKQLIESTRLQGMRRRDRR